MQSLFSPMQVCLPVIAMAIVFVAETLILRGGIAIAEVFSLLEHLSIRQLAGLQARECVF